jgi:hypothetical protein
MLFQCLTLAPYATMDFWVDSSGYPGHRIINAYTGNTATKSGSAYGDSTWIPEQGGVATIGGTAWPPPNGAAFGYSSLPNPVPYLTLPTAINYTSLSPPPSSKSMYAGVFKYSGSTQELFQSHGAITLTGSMLTRPSALECI